jgi:hypothetical protein
MQATARPTTIRSCRAGGSAGSGWCERGHGGEKRFDAEEIRRLLKSEGNIRRVIDDLYGADATHDARARTVTVADVLGGRGESCRIELAGPYAGRFRDFNPGGTKESGDLIDAVMEVRRLSFPEALAHIGEPSRERRRASRPSRRPGSRRRRRPTTTSSRSTPRP